MLVGRDTQPEFYGFIHVHMTKHYDTFLLQCCISIAPNNVHQCMRGATMMHDFDASPWDKQAKAMAVRLWLIHSFVGGLVESD